MTKDPTKFYEDRIKGLEKQITTIQLEYINSKDSSYAQKRLFSLNLENKQLIQEIKEMQKALADLHERLSIYITKNNALETSKELYRSAWIREKQQNTKNK